jgi:hypothetical protein
MVKGPNRGDMDEIASATKQAIPRLEDEEKNCTI